MTMRNPYHKQYRFAALIVVLMAGLVGAPVLAVTVSSPDGTVQASISVVSGRLTYSMTRGATTVVENSPMGVTVSGTDLGNGLTSDNLGTATSSTIDNTFNWDGNSTTIRNYCTECTIPVNHPSRAYSLVVRAYNNGLAFKYVVPGGGTVTGEATGWTVPSGSTEWYQTDTTAYEGSYSSALSQSLAAGLNIGPPLTYKLPGSGGYASISEAAANVNYSGMTLKSGSSGSRLITAQFQDNSSGWTVSGTITSPWRVIMAGADLNGLVQASNIIPAACPAPDSGVNWSFVKPGRAVWSWWKYGNLTDTDARVTLEKRYIDQAAQLGFEYTVLDSGFSTTMSSTHQSQVLAEAQAMNIGPWLWTYWWDLDDGTFHPEWGKTPATRLALWQSDKSRGFVGLKIDFMNSEAVNMLSFYEGNMRVGSQVGMMVDFHGANKGTGEERTFPNQLTREGVMGLEHYQTGSNPAPQNVVLPFARNLAGTMDYTPVTFSSNSMGGTSWPHQLATPIVFQSSLTNWAEDPAILLANPGVDVIKAIPTTWDQTIVLPGSEIGQTAAFARRKGTTWFIGIVNTTTANTLNISLSFLSTGQYSAVILADDSANNVSLRPHHARRQLQFDPDGHHAGLRRLRGDAHADVDARPPSPGGTCSTTTPPGTPPR